MAATTDQVRRLRRMVAESTDETYSDEDLQGYIERHPIEDARGEGPWIESSTTPGTLEANPDWTATYDLHLTAAEVWEEKAAALAGDYDFQADGASYSRSQAHDQAMRQARFHRARRCPTTITQRPEPLSQGSEELESAVE